MKWRASDVAVVVIVAIVLIALLAGWRDCNAVGGRYVRGLFWMECLR